MDAIIKLYIVAVAQILSMKVPCPQTCPLLATGGL